MKNVYLFLSLLIILSACGGGKSKQKEQTSQNENTEIVAAVKESQDDEDSESEIVSIGGGEAQINVMNEKSLPRGINFDQDIERMSYQELRVWLYYVYAIHGMHIIEADLYGFFTVNTDWYEKLVWELWDYDKMPEKMEDVSLTQEEQAFVDRIRRQMSVLQKNNFVATDNGKLGNVNNIVNLFQFQDVDKQFLEKIEKNNFVISRGKNLQLFHVYEENDYRQIPNFITTDLYLQAFHMYFSYTLKSLVQEKFIPILTDLCHKMYSKSKALTKSSDEEIRRLAEFNTTFYAIPYYLFTDKKLELSAEQQKHFNTEIKNITKEGDEISEYLSWTDAVFGYSLFKPRGHYTRKEEMKKYFKAMMWLQTAPFCLDESEKLNQTIFSSALLADNDIYAKYKSIYEPIAFLVGLPDNLSFMDIADYMKKENIQRVEDALSSGNRAKIEGMLKELAKTRNQIKPEIEITCTDKINFMPQRYLIDNDVMQKMVDVEKNSERAYPRGLDVFAAFGSKAANDILTNVYKDQAKWDQFSKRLNDNKTKFGDFKDWDKSVYNKWIKSLVDLQKVDKQYPEFMQTEAWSRKNLNTALAPWAELKHDAILYGEQPMAAECGGGGPPEPIVRGYVEPNLKFWNQLKELLNLTEKVLKDNKLLTEDLQSKNEQLSDYVKFLIQVSKKELAGQLLDDEEYQTIEYIGSSIEYFTLSVIEPGLYLFEWNDVKGPDKSVAVVADIYTRNVRECNKNGILHVATGNVNNIYVVVPIGNELYLTKGATFSYYEFVQPLGTRLTDEEWQQMLEDGKAPAEQEWMKDIIIGTEPSVDERVFYSSGC